MVTIREIVKNIAKGQSSIAVKHVLQQLNANYQKIRNRMRIVTAKPDGTGVLINLKVPSSDKKDVFYDIVLWINEKSRMTLDSEFKCYSNSPAFAFNFAYVFNTAGSLLYPEKYPHEFVAMPPKVRNPYGLYGFDKHVFATIKYVGSHDLEKLVEQYKTATEEPIDDFATKQSQLTGRP